MRFFVLLISLCCLVLSCSCGGSPKVVVNSECLTDLQCLEGYFCDDEYKCVATPGVDGDVDSETGEQSENAESVEDQESADDMEQQEDAASR